MAWSGASSCLRCSSQSERLGRVADAGVFDVCKRHFARVCEAAATGDFEVV
jgi:hypothetical protein